MLVLKIIINIRIYTLMLWLFEKCILGTKTLIKQFITLTFWQVY